MRVIALIVVAALAAGLLISGGSTQTLTSVQYINAAGRSDDRPYSNAVLAGNTLYLAGAIGVDPSTGAPPEDVREEVKIVLDGMKGRLEEVGMTMDDLVSVQVFCSDLSLYDTFNEVYKSYFKNHYPARAFIGSGPLLRGARFEVMGVAVKG